MENNEEVLTSNFSSKKTSTSSYNDDTLTQEVNNPYFPTIRPRGGPNPLPDKYDLGHNSVYISSSNINENNNNLKRSILNKSKTTIENIDINNNDDNRIYGTKKLKTKKFNKKNTINHLSSANEFQKTMLEQKNLIGDKLEDNFGIALKPLEEQWKYQKILLDYNILDFTSKYKLLCFIFYFIF